MLDALDAEESNPSPRNTSLRTDRMITKELRPISEMFPYLLRQAGKQPFPTDLKALTIERPCIVPQNHNHFDSGITYILLIQDHAVAGSDVCKCITPDVLDLEVERTAVMIEMNIMFKSYDYSHPTSAYCYIYVSFGVVFGWVSPFSVLYVPLF